MNTAYVYRADGRLDCYDVFMLPDSGGFDRSANPTGTCTVDQAHPSCLRFGQLADLDQHYGIC